MNREFKLERDKLNEENKEIFKKIQYRLSVSQLHERIYENNIKEVLNMLLEGQKRNESYKEVIGEDLEGFCENIIESSYKTNAFQRMFKMIYIYNLAIVVYMIIWSLISLVADERVFSIFYTGELGKINIMNFGTLFIILLINHYINELRAKTTFRSKIIKFTVYLIALIYIFMQPFIYEKLDIGYSIYLNNYLVLGFSLEVVILYKIYNYLIMKKYNIN